MRITRSSGPSCAPAFLLALALAGCTPRETTIALDPKPTSSATDKPESKILELGPQARKNLSLIVAQARPTDYWRTITIPGVVADQPGISDRGVTSPAVGVVSEIHVFPGDTVRPGQQLVTIRLFSEYLQATQTQLFKAAHEATLLQNQLDRLNDAAVSGAISGSRLVELKNEQERQRTIVQASRQELLNRGLSASQIDAVSAGSFVSSISVVAPPSRSNTSMLQGQVPQPVESSVQTVAYQVDVAHDVDVAYEVQSLAVELGQTVQAGELVVNLANHQSLYVVGHAFKREAGLIEQAAQNNLPVEIEFAEDSAERWPSLDQEFSIRHLANTVDPNTRTFDFFVPMRNQSRTYEKAGTKFLVWRFRPGQRTRINVPVEKMANVFVLPAEAVARDRPDAFVYRQNGDLFNQIAVHVVYEDRRQVVVANDGSITPGTYLAQNAAASLRRVLKAQSASGDQPGLHVHADGTVHAAH